MVVGGVVGAGVSKGVVVGDPVGTVEPAGDGWLADGEALGVGLADSSAVSLGLVDPVGWS